MSMERLQRSWVQFRKNVRRIHQENGGEIKLGSEMRFAPSGDEAVFDGVEATPEELVLHLDRRIGRVRDKVAVLQKYALAGLATEMTMHEANGLLSRLKNYATHFAEKCPDDRYSGFMQETVKRLTDDFDFLARFKVSSDNSRHATPTSILAAIDHEFPRALNTGSLEIVTTPAFMAVDSWVDDRIMHAVVINLVRNSYYWASSSGQRKTIVRFDVERIEHEVDIWDDETETTSKGMGHTDIIIVEDNGPGLPPGKGDDLFEPGMSGRRSSGIGLYICRAGLESHYQTIIADEQRSDLGGARFRIGSLSMLRPDVDRNVVADKPRELSLAQALESMIDLVKEENNVEAIGLTDVYEEAAGLAMKIRLRGHATPLEERLVKAVDDFHWQLANTAPLDRSGPVFD
jgi:nitrogen-specific signal transduction histidine kinase